MCKNFYFFCTGIVIILCSCQKELDPDVDLKISSDSLATIVITGNPTGNGGYFAGYDSAVITYNSASTIIKHYSNPAVAVGTETIRYDNNKRVVGYQFYRVDVQTELKRSFVYTGLDSFPSQIIDTFQNQYEHSIAKYVLAKSATEANLKRLQYKLQFSDLVNPSWSYSDSSDVWLNAAGQLVRHENFTDKSRYFYSSGNIDSSLYTESSGYSNFYSISYSSLYNPLAAAGKLIYKNLLAYIITDQLDNSAFEAALDICYLPSDLLLNKIPTQTKSGETAAYIWTSNTYSYTMQGQRVATVKRSEQDLSAGTTDVVWFMFAY